MSGMLNYFGKLMKPAEEAEFHGIETSKGVIPVVSDKAKTEDGKEDSKSQLPLETKAEFRKRRESERSLEQLMQGKFVGDLMSADDLADSNLMGHSREDELTFKGGRELDIILQAVDYLKGAMFKAGTRCAQTVPGELDISIADKSQLIVWVYKELREQQQRNEQLKKDLADLRVAYNEKLAKLEELQRTVADFKDEREKLSARLKAAAGERQRLEELLTRHAQKYKEMCNMESHEIFRLSSVIDSETFR